MFFPNKKPFNIKVGDIMVVKSFRIKKFENLKVYEYVSGFNYS